MEEPSCGLAPCVEGLEGSSVFNMQGRPPKPILYLSRSNKNPVHLLSCEHESRGRSICMIYFSQKTKREIGVYRIQQGKRNDGESLRA